MEIVLVDPLDSPRSKNFRWGLEDLKTELLPGSTETMWDL